MKETNRRIEMTKKLMADTSIRDSDGTGIAHR